MNVAFGPVLDQYGMGSRRRFSTDPADFLRPVRRTCWATPASEVRSQQPPSIGVNVNHARANVGQVVYLERSHGYLWAVAHVPDWIEPADASRFWSAEVDCQRDGSDIEITALGIVERSAQIGLRPITVLRGQLDHHGATERWTLDPSQQALLQRAADSHLDRRYGQPLIVHDLEGTHAAAAVERSSAQPLEYRSAAVRDVSERERTITLVTMPYEQPTLVAHAGRMIEEVCSRGAFNDIHQQTNKVRVNRDHDLARTIGKAIAFDASDPRGLVAEVKIARTRLGDESLALAEDGVLDASAAFRALDLKWETSDRRRLTKCWLGHIALTPDPAYQGANVLAVRAG